MNETYRLYSFAHSWLSGIQKGIQTQHATVELLIGPCKSWNFVKKWATEDKTTIVLEGGGTKSLEYISELCNVSPFPSAHFCEDQESLNGSITAVVVVLPEWLYSVPYEKKEEDVPEYLWDLFEVVKSAQLAS